MKIYTLIYTYEGDCGYDCAVKPFRTLEEANAEMRKQYSEALVELYFDERRSSIENYKIFCENSSAEIVIGTDNEYNWWNIQTDEI